MQPQQEVALKDFGGLDALLVVLGHCAGVLATIEEVTVVPEWDALKAFWKVNCSHLSSSDVWLVLTKNGDLYPNVWSLLQILLLSPVSNAVVEMVLALCGLYQDRQAV